MASTRFSNIKANQQRILLTQAESGMELAEPVLSIGDAILYSADNVLNDDLILHLMTLGIKRITIKGKHTRGRKLYSLADQESMLIERFSRCRKGGLMASIQDCVRRNLREPTT